MLPVSQMSRDCLAQMMRCSGHTLLCSGELLLAESLHSFMTSMHSVQHQHDRDTGLGPPASTKRCISTSKP